MLKQLFLKCEKNSRMTGDERREQILRTAIELFSKYGFNGTTTKKIASAAGISEAMVFRHFASKDELYEAILHSKICEDGDTHFPWEEDLELTTAMNSNDDAKVFYILAKRFLEKQQSDEDFIRLMLYSGLEEHKLAEEFILTIWSKLYLFVCEYIKKRQLSGAMRDLDPKIVVRALMGMLIHHSLNNILWDKNRQILDVTNEEAARSFVDILLKGVKRTTEN